MLINAFRIDEDKISKLCEIIRKDVADSEDKLIFEVLLPFSNEARLIKSIIDSFKEEVREMIRRGGVRELMCNMLELFYVINKISDIEEHNITLDNIKSELSTKLSVKDREKIKDDAKKVSDILITSRNCVKIFDEARRIGLKDRISQMFVYVLDRVLRGTELELASIEKVPPHIDIHIIKVFLRMGIIVPVREVLNRYAGESKYIVRILPVCAKLAPDEPFKTIWDVLRRKCIDVFGMLRDSLNMSQIALSIYLSMIGRRFCIFNDDVKARDDYCPVKGLITCPLSQACSSYLGDNRILIFSRRQMRLVLRFFNAPRSIIENSCECLLI